MRARNIKPGFFKDEELAALPFEGRLLFAGLWLLCDAMGRMEDRPRLVKHEIFPYDDIVSAARVHELLQVLHEGEFITRYEIGGQKYIQVINFIRHQNPHKNEKEKGSLIPDPPDRKETRPVGVPYESGTSPVLEPKKSVLVPFEDGTSLDESGLLNHESRLLKAAPQPQRPVVVPAPLLEFPSEPSVADHHPETRKAVVERFPDADEALIVTLIQKCVQEVLSVGRPVELVSDEVIAYAVRLCTKRKQLSAGLYLTTVPTFLRNQAMEDLQNGAE